MRVRIYFDKPASLVLELNEEQIEALEDEYSWEPFYDACESELTDHFAAYGVIDDVVVLDN